MKQLHGPMMDTPLTPTPPLRAEPPALREENHRDTSDSAAPAGFDDYEALLTDVRPVPIWPDLAEAHAAGMCYASGTPRSAWTSASVTRRARASPGRDQDGRAPDPWSWVTAGSYDSRESSQRLTLDGSFRTGAVATINAEGSASSLVASGSAAWTSRT